MAPTCALRMATICKVVKANTWTVPIATTCWVRRALACSVVRLCTCAVVSANT